MELNRILTQRRLLLNQFLNIAGRTPFCSAIIEHQRKNSRQFLDTLVVDAVIHVKTQDVIEHPDHHEIIDFGLELQQNVDVDRLAAQLDFVNQIAFRLFVMVGDKRFIQRFRSAEIKLLHPTFADEGLDQLLEDRAVGKEFFVTRIVNFWLRCFGPFVLHTPSV